MTSPAPAAVADLSRYPGQLARRFVQLTHQTWTSVVSEETTPPQFTVLNTLLAWPDIDQITVGNLASLDRSTVADVVARLVQRGQIRRSRDPQDGRRNILRLTARGETTHGEVAARLGRLDDELLAPLTPDERTALVGLLSRVVNPDPWEGHPLTEMYGGKDAPRCAVCRRPYSQQEAAAGMATCEHCPPPF